MLLVAIAVNTIDIVSAKEEIFNMSFFSNFLYHYI